MKLSAPISLLVLPLAASSNADVAAVGGKGFDVLALITDMQAKIESLENEFAKNRDKITKLEAAAPAIPTTTASGKSGIQRGLTPESPPGQQCDTTVDYELIGVQVDIEDLIQFTCDTTTVNAVSFTSRDSFAPSCVTDCANANFNGTIVRGPYALNADLSSCTSNCGNVVNNVVLTDGSEVDLDEFVTAIVAEVCDVPSPPTPEDTCEAKKGKKACQRSEGCEWTRGSCKKED